MGVLRQTSHQTKGASSQGSVIAEHRDRPEGGNMLRWALIFFIVALVAAVFGFWGIVAAAAGIAKLLFFLFLVLFLISLVGGLVRRA
jgi:uncharacterized membrane protein YtjA (UPF0391 family)